MINFIENLVTRYPNNLKFHPNQGEDRVRNDKFKGSLWIRGKKGFRLQTTSEVASILDREIERLHGDPIGEQKGYKYWHIDDYRVVEKIIEFFAQS